MKTSEKPHDDKARKVWQTLLAETGRALQKIDGGILMLINPIEFNDLEDVDHLCLPEQRKKKLTAENTGCGTRYDFSASSDGILERSFLMENFELQPGEVHESGDPLIFESQRVRNIYYNPPDRKGVR